MLITKSVFWISSGSPPRSARIGGPSPHPWSFVACKPHTLRKVSFWGALILQNYLNIRTHTYIYVCVCACMYIYIYAHTHIYTNNTLSIYLCIYLSIYLIYLDVCKYLKLFIIQTHPWSWSLRTLNLVSSAGLFINQMRTSPKFSEAKIIHVMVQNCVFWRFEFRIASEREERIREGEHPLSVIGAHGGTIGKQISTASKKVSFPTWNLNHSEPLKMKNKKTRTSIF